MGEALIGEILARARAIAARAPAERPIRLSVAPIVATIAEARFRAETEQRPVLTIKAGQSVTVFPIGTRPAT